MAYVIIKEQPHVKGWGMDTEVVIGKVLFEGYIDAVPRKGEQVMIDENSANVDLVVNNISYNTITVYVRDVRSTMHLS